MCRVRGVLLSQIGTEYQSEVLLEMAVERWCLAGGGGQVRLSRSRSQMQEFQSKKFGHETGPQKTRIPFSPNVENPNPIFRSGTGSGMWDLNP